MIYRAGLSRYLIDPPIVMHRNCYDRTTLCNINYLEPDCMALNGPDALHYLCHPLSSVIHSHQCVAVNGIFFIDLDFIKLLVCKDSYKCFYFPTD